MAADLERVCVLSEPSLQRWQVDALERAVSAANVTVTLLVVEDEGESGGAAATDRDRVSALANPRRIGATDVKLFLRTLRRKRGWALVRAEQKLAWLLWGPNRQWELIQRSHPDDVDCLADAERIYCEPIADERGWNRLPDEVVDDVAERSDVVVAFGFGLLTGRLLDATPYGVLGFHPADVRVYRGHGPEQTFLNGDSRGAATLQQLTDDIDGGRIVAIESVDVSDACTLDDVWARLLELQSRMLADGIEKLRDAEFDPEPPERLGRYYSKAERYRLRFGLRVIARNNGGRLRRWLRERAHGLSKRGRPDG